MDTRNHHDWTGLTPPEHPTLPITIIATGRTACFSDPMHPADRTTYPIPTPAAITGLLTAIHWKPQFRWIPISVDILNPIEFRTIVRNELKTVEKITEATGIDVTEVKNRAQRNTTHLTDVAYRIRAGIWQHPDAVGSPVKHREMFNRRVRNGQYHTAPYLGAREHTADITPDDPTRTPIDLTMPLGLVHHSFDWDNKQTPGWFPATITNGTVHYPAAPTIIGTIR